SPECPAPGPARSAGPGTQRRPGGPGGRPAGQHCDRRDRSGTSIGAVTTTLGFSNSPPRSADADAVVIGVLKGPDGPLLAPGAADIDDALGGDLAATLATLGATGQAEEITRLPGGGRLAAPLIV